MAEPTREDFQRIVDGVIIDNPQFDSTSFGPNQRPASFNEDLQKKVEKAVEIMPPTDREILAARREISHDFHDVRDQLAALGYGSEAVAMAALITGIFETLVSSPRRNPPGNTSGW